MLAAAGTAAAALAVTAALSGAAAGAPHQAPARGSASRASGRLMEAFNAAARESGVPASLLLAIGYNESRWEPHGTMPSADGGYGLMNLTTRTFTVAGAAGKPGSQPRRVSLVKTHYTLGEAARLLHVPAGTLKTMLQGMIHRGATIFLTSHVLEIVERLCSHVAIVHKGKLVAQGSLEELRAGVPGSEDEEGPKTLEQIFLSIVGQSGGEQAKFEELTWLT